MKTDAEIIAELQAQVSELKVLARGYAQDIKQRIKGLSLDIQDCESESICEDYGRQIGRLQRNLLEINHILGE